MGVKEFLEQANNLDSKINSLIVELTNFRQLSTKISDSQITEKVSHSGPTEAPYAKWVESIVDTEREINTEIDRLIAVKLV